MFSLPLHNLVPVPSLQMKMLSFNVPFIIFVFSLCFHITIQNNKIIAITEEFQIKYITIIKDGKNDDAKLMKLAFENALFINISKGIKKVLTITDVNSHLIIYIHPEKNLERELKHLLKKQQIKVMLILKNKQFQSIYNNLELEICHQVFLLKESSQELYETYIINSQHTKRKIGHINLNTNKFIWNKNVNSNFYKRRANFHGLVLKAMTEFSGLNMNAHSTYITNAPYYSNNQTYLVNGYTYGFYNDLLHTLEYELNFTTLIFKRKERSWGYIYPQLNGSYVGTGIVGDIFFERADIVVAPLAIILRRRLYIDYLPPVRKIRVAIYTATANLDESMDLKLFITPFTISVWVIISIISILTAIFKSFIFCYYDTVNILEFLSAIWTSFIVYFGGKPTKKSVETQIPYKIIVFTSLLGGSLIWIAYRSYLTSQLSFMKIELPFTDMKSFSKTNWRCITFIINNYIYHKCFIKCSF